MNNKTNSAWEFFLMDKEEVKSEAEFRQNTLQSDTKTCKKVCPHFEAFIDFYSFFLLVPFRVKFDHKTRQYKIVYSPWRKVSTLKIT